MCLRLLESGRDNWYLPDGRAPSPGSQLVFVSRERDNRPLQPLASDQAVGAGDRRRDDAISARVTARRPPSAPPWQDKGPVRAAQPPARSFRGGPRCTRSSCSRRWPPRMWWIRSWWRAPICMRRAERGLYTGATFKTVEGDPRQYFMFTEFAGVRPRPRARQRQNGSTPRISPDFLRAHQPDVVHFQHTHMIGYDVLTVTRRVLPRTPDRLHAARVPPDLPPRGADDPHRTQGERALHTCVATALQRVLPRGFSAALFSEREVHQGPSRKRRHVPGTEPLPPPALHRMGNPGRADQVRGAGTSAASKPGRRGRGGATAQPARLLRAAHPIQGR